MEIIKIIGIGLVALILIIILKQYKPEFTIYVSLLAGALILALIFSKISGIIELINNLTNKISIHKEFVTLLVKITGIAILTEFAVSICKDSGETAIASKVDMGGKVIMVSMTIPIMAGLLETLLKILP
jgi:stage III sporulation protein AD